MKTIDQTGPHRILQSVKYNFIKVLILPKGVVVVLRLPEGSFFTH